MLWLEIAVAALLIKGVYDIWKDAQRDKRTSSLEWLQTVPLDERIEARRRQIAYEEAEALKRAYGVAGRTSRPFVPSRPLGGVHSGPRPRTTLPPLGEVWEPHVAHQNGYAEWNG